MLIVSGYYNIPSKRDCNFYYNHIERFFRYVKTPVLFFTDIKNYEILKKWKTEYITFYIQEFEELDVFRYFPIDFWKSEIQKDPENKYHTWQLGALWANKARFVNKALTLYPNYEWYMWVDAGCIRNDAWAAIIDNFGKRKLPDIPGIYCQLLNNSINKKYFKFPDISIAGSHILFHKNFIQLFINSYSDMLKQYNSNNISLISDQYIISSMALTYSFINTILYNPNIHSIDRWFFFFYLF